jgi:MYXO-CTERM domain-containing protein
MQAKQTTGKTPACPDYAWCSGPMPSTGSGIGGGLGWVGGSGNGDDVAITEPSGGCATAPGGGDSEAFAALGLAVAAIFVRRRRARE